MTAEESEEGHHEKENVVNSIDFHGGCYVRMQFKSTKGERYGSR